MSRPPPENWKSGFPRRLAAYAGGIAIGLMLLGLIQQAKRGMRPPAAPPGAVQPAQNASPDPGVKPSGAGEGTKGADVDKDGGAVRKPAADKPGTSSPSATTGGG